MTKPKIIVALPAYNEALNLGALLDSFENVLGSILGYGFDRLYVVVDDGSADKTQKILREYADKIPLTVLVHERNQGLGPTIRDALRRATEEARQGDIVITMDADNTHPPEVIRDLVKVVSTTAEVVVASRYKGGAEVGVPLKRRILSKVVNLLIRNLCGISILDCTSGYRAYRLEVLKRLSPLESKGFEVTAEILIRISSHKPSCKIEEIPLTLYYDRKKGSSKIHVGQTIKAYIKLLWKTRVLSSERRKTEKC